MKDLFDKLELFNILQRTLLSAFDAPCEWHL